MIKRFTQVELEIREGSSHLEKSGGDPGALTSMRRD